MKMRVKRGDCVLVVVDVQDRLIDTIAEHEALIQNIKALIKAALVFQLPILVTEQERLGSIVPELRHLLAESSIHKLTFSCCDSPEFMTKLNETRRKTVLLCGIETHICVMQTALDLLAGHHRILVVKDATSSYSLIDRETALSRLQECGGEVTTAEATIYELTEKAGTEEFRKILDIVKERRTSISDRPSLRVKKGKESKGSTN